MRDRYLTIDKSYFLYGIGIILMVFHHLFAFPDRIDYSYVPLLDFSFYHLETIISYFGKVCVSIYAFVSGYALCIKYKDSYDLKDGYLYVFKKLIKFYKTFFIIFICFIPLGFILEIYDFHLIEFIKNLIGYSASYNKEWWYVKQYVEMLLLLPIIMSIMKFIHNRVLNYYYRLIIYLLVFIIIFIDIKFLSNNSFIVYTACFILGIVISYEQIFSKIHSNIKINWILVLILLTIIFFIRVYLLWSNKYDILIIPFFCYLCCELSEINFFKRYVNKILIELGKKSKYIFYIHTFFVYYYFQNIIFLPKYSLLIFIWTMVICYVVSVVLHKIDRLI